MRLETLDRGHPLRTKALLAMIRLVSRQPVVDAVKLALYRPNFYGMLGGGGSILMVPVLTYIGGLDAKQAIATSLLVVGATSAIGAIGHARAGRVRWGVGLVFGLAGMAGAYGGGLLARFASGRALLVGFAILMCVAAVAMLRGRADLSDKPRAPARRLAALGLAVGVVMGLVGAGGGFLLVPALVLLGALPMPAAVGTSLVVIAMQSFAGLAGHLASTPIDWRLAGVVTAVAVVGGLVGGRLTALVEPDVLRQGFGWFVLGMASLILAQEAGPVVGAAAAAMCVLGIAMSLGCRRFGLCPWRRLFPAPT
jgi:uncharacterized protein